MHFTYSEGKLARSPWVLPLLCLSLTLVIACNHIHPPSNRKKRAVHSERKKHKGSQDLDFGLEELKEHITTPSKIYEKNRQEVVIQVGHLGDGRLLHSNAA